MKPGWHRKELISGLFRRTTQIVGQYLRGLEEAPASRLPPGPELILTGAASFPTDLYGTSPLAMSEERSKHRVLVVDDDAAIRAAMKPVLEEAGYEVVLAADGETAVGRFASEPFDLLILDLNLPHLQGWDVFERVTTRDPLIPVIIITAMPDQFRTALAAGVGALMEKPVDVPALLAVMDQLLAERKENHLLRLYGHLRDTRHLRRTASSQSRSAEDCSNPVGQPTTGVQNAAGHKRRGRRWLR